MKKILCTTDSGRAGIRRGGIQGNQQDQDWRRRTVGTMWRWIATPAGSTSRTAPAWKWSTPMPAKCVGTIGQLHGVHGIALAPDLNKGFITNGQSQQRHRFRPEDSRARPANRRQAKTPTRSATSPKTQARFHDQPQSGNDATIIDAKTNEVCQHRSRLGLEPASSARWMAPARSTSTWRPRARWWRSMPPRRT